MPAELEALKNKIASKLKGKTNPKTNKPYTESDFSAIANTQYKKTHKGSMHKEITDLRMCSYSNLKLKEEEGDMYVQGFIATSHPDRAISFDSELGIEFDGDIISD